ncbi:hypothetical protein N6A79_03725 [Bartonella sp. HY761]|nr:hypothetical protein [Bartonella sp. HY761]UXN07128.1 hypothetical protein N6A79_03725 [Bartonella sp. HY761]
MAIFNLFSKRQKALRGEVSDVYQYDELPEKMRVQICHILNDLLSLSNVNSRYKYEAKQIFILIVKQLSREYGLTQLVGGIYHNDNDDTLIKFISTEKDIEKCLDAIELVFGFFTKCFDNKEFGWHEQILESNFKDLIVELNHRFKENSVGYQFINGRIIRVDSELLHQEAVKPALNLLSDTDYSGANNEFLAAFEHYKNNEYSATLIECLKAFESTMKIICTKHQWSFDKNDASRQLIDICLKMD